MNLAQRIVLVVALGAALRTVGTYALNSRQGGGWFAYTPLSRESFYPVNDSGWQPVVWITLIAVWAAASVWLLAPDRD